MAYIVPLDPKVLYTYIHLCTHTFSHWAILPHCTLQLTPQFNAMGFMCTGKVVSFNFVWDSFVYFWM